MKAAPGLIVEIDSSNRAVLTEGTSRFQLKQPGLSGGSSTVSLMSLDKPGWFVKHSSQDDSVVLEYRGQVVMDDSSTYDEEATYIVHTDTFFPGHVALESFATRGRYLALQEPGTLAFIRQTNDTSFPDSASIKLQDVAIGTRKRRSISSGTCVLMSIYLSVYGIVLSTVD